VKVRRIQRKRRRFVRRLLDSELSLSVARDGNAGVLILRRDGVEQRIDLASKEEQRALRDMFHAVVSRRDRGPRQE